MMSKEDKMMARTILFAADKIQKRIEETDNFNVERLADTLKTLAEAYNILKRGKHE